MGLPNRRHTTLTTDALHDLQQMQWRMSLVLRTKLTMSETISHASRIIQGMDTDALGQAMVTAPPTDPR